MANWIFCNYHDLEQQHKNVGMYHTNPINLDHVLTYHYEGSDIIFIIPTKDNIRWEFINEAVMRIEFQRINDHIAANPR